MIDKNDVKMPVQRKDAELIAGDKEQVKKIEELLRLVNQTEKKQELRLKGDYYSKFDWFKTGAKVNDKSYFSYQEEAVYDFVFNLNKSGILSDQVGMGKTIEAGMIISELASRNELRSLLIIVPNEIMAQKWEHELKDKFGITDYPIAGDGEERAPMAKALKSYDDFCKCVFECVAEDKFFDFANHNFAESHKKKKSLEGTFADVLPGFVQEDIKIAVDLINEGFALAEMPGNPRVKFDGKEFWITGTNFRKPYQYGNFLRSGSRVATQFQKITGRTLAKQIVTFHNFDKTYAEIIEYELEGLSVIIGDYFTKLKNEITLVAENMVSRYPILVIPIAYSEYNGDKVKLVEFLNKPILPRMENYKHKCIVQTADNKIEVEFEDYRIIDFFIDVGYQTLIVDEVHDYIDVCAKMEINSFHQNNGYTLFPSNAYNRYELFDDYYFIKKGSLYKKLKGLADKANRKIFLTATPIKSDMVDFYLLTLLASNKDSEAFKKISESFKRGADEFTHVSQMEEAIDAIYNSFQNSVSMVVDHFCNFNRNFFKQEERDSATASDENKVVRYVYPYFNNEYLHKNATNAEAVENYLLSHMSYMSVEEIVLNLILSYNAEKKENNDVLTTVKSIIELLNSEPNDFETRVVFRTILNNTIKQRFEEDFTDQNGTPIKRIRELLEYEDGPRKWHKTYRKYGIRHTRHQTYNLTDCADIDKLNKNKMERYKNLPIWPRRDGKVIFLTRDDVFFDCFINVRRQLEASLESKEVRMQDLPNVDKMIGEEEEKLERFENAKAIFDYINNSMSGGSADSHEPQSSNYESVELDDALMVDYKLALVNKLMRGDEPNLGAINKKVLLFAENNRDEIVEWFKYQKAAPLYDGEKLDSAKLKEYEEKRERYKTESIGGDWKVSESADDLSKYADDNLLIIIDPKRYEKGVDLQKADTIINFDINYCPLKMEQRIGRIDRIRPNGQSQEITIISFVPLNDMSGFVINFFANELKMFTQWMGETTGIVSVPEEEKKGKGGEDVSFEGKVYNLEKYYKHIYELCKDDVPLSEQNKMVEDFKRLFGVNDYKAMVDFKFLNELRPYFDSAFRHSMTPQRAGYTIKTDKNKRVVRFNSALGAFADCGADNCEKCTQRQYCEASGADVHNRFVEFTKGVNNFFSKGLDFYVRERRALEGILARVVIKNKNGESSMNLSDWMDEREQTFRRAKDVASKLLSSISGSTSKPFTIPMDKYNEIFLPMKELYWDSIAQEYVDLILGHFYKQCDSVLKSARLFEKFIKTLSIADFMNNMEGTV